MPRAVTAGAGPRRGPADRRPVRPNSRRLRTDIEIRPRRYLYEAVERGSAHAIGSVN